MPRLLALLATLFATGPVRAMDIESRFVSQSVSFSTAGRFALTADVGRSTEATAAGRHISETTLVGATWRQGGFKATVMAGFFTYDWTGAGEGVARMVSYAVGHEFNDVAGGVLSMEFRQARIQDGDSELVIGSARLGWSLKF
jgi:hypothetical protein